MRAPLHAPDPGLGVLPRLRVLPHFDKMLARVPDLLTRALMQPPAGTIVLGIDEDTALVDLTGAGHTWQGHGRQQAWTLPDGAPRGRPARTPLSAPQCPLAPLWPN